MTFLSLELLAAHHYRPLYGAPEPPTPTPNIATVPLPALTLTATPFLIVTVEPSPPATASPPTPTSIATAPAASPAVGDQPTRAVTSPATSDNGPAGATTTVTGQEGAAQVAPNLSAAPSAELPPSATITGTVLVNVLNMRQEPSADAALVDTLPGSTVVKIMHRDASGGWLYVCCGSRTQQAGWVSADFIQTNASIIPLAGSLPEREPISITQAAPQDVALTFEIQPTPDFVWQGQILTLQFVINNRGNLPLTNLQVRDDLPPELLFIRATASEAGEVQQEGRPEDGLIFTLAWPTLAAGGQVTGTVTVQVAPTTPNGVLINNVAVAHTQEYGDVLGGISITMPPAGLPRF